MTPTILFVLLYGWLLGPRFVFLDLMWVFVALSMLFVPASGRVRKAFDGPIVWAWSLAAALVFYSAAISVGNGDLGFGFAIAWVKALIYSLSSIGLLGLYERTYGPVAIDRLVRDLVWGGAISALITLIIFTTPSVRAVTSSIIAGKIASSYPGMIGLRAYDLSIGGGTGYGLFNLVLAIVMYLHKHLFAPRVRAVFYVLFALSTFASTRSVFLVGSTLGVLALIYNFSWRSAARFFANVMLAAGAILIVGWLSLSSGLLSSVVDSEQIDVLVEKTIPWAFEIFLNYNEGEGLRSETTDIIANEQFLPDSWVGIAFGIGDFEPLSDSGLVRTIFAVGVFGFAIQMIVTGVFLFHFISRNNGRNARRTMVMASALLLAFNFKEITFSNGRGLFGLFVILFYGFLLLRPSRYGVQQLATAQSIQ